ncbi:hypothetical protein [Deinococcus roseus]|uniref:Uncharacterized protein n=1 Tax=Deinococcus roseus TaxID=392414 RepID=A0ABQ2DGH1_9DEIO|nr:hypothetical protein [Deinococcus roseus]GGJ55449.1 hypothetical protein GCM10008938_47010 [Deinococcus roseus]
MNETQIQGRIGGASVGYDIHATRGKTSIQGRIGGMSIGKDIQLVVNHHTVQGRIGGRSDGFDVHFDLSGTPTGRLGATPSVRTSPIRAATTRALTRIW